MRLILIIGILILSAPGASIAQSVGLLLGVSDYDALPDVRRGTRPTGASARLEAAGMEVIKRLDPTGEDMTQSLLEFGQKARQSDSLLIALSGRFIHTTTETYYLPADGMPGPLPELNKTALPLSTVFAYLATKPEKSILVLATDNRSGDYDDLLSAGLGAIEPPEGVTVIRGGVNRTFEVLNDILPRVGRPFVGAARQKKTTVLGFDSNTAIFLDTPDPVQPLSVTDRLADIRDWRAASAENTTAAYQAYVKAHPQGEFVAMAEGRIKALTDTPEARAERAEQALDLSRDARRAIQRDLSLLGYNTRGIDGIFGGGTRGAIAGWQKSQNLAATGFLTGDEITLLSEQANLRAAELEAEAEARRQAQLAADIAYWDQTGALGDEPGLRAYLERFPDGEYSELATQRLFIIEERKLTRADRIDRRLWDEAKQIDTADGYESYLAQSPNGAFRDEAQARLVTFQRDAQFAEAARAESAMNMSRRTRQVVEARLAGLGLRPGPIDGAFDDDTRRAIRRYQSARNMPETGYLTDQVIVQLMADTVRQIFR